MAKFVGNMPKAELVAELENQKKKAEESAENSDERRYALTAIRRLNEALAYVGDSGLTYRQKIEKQVKEVKPARKWTRGSMEGQYGRFTVYTSGEYEIRSIDGTFFVYKGGDMEGMCDKLGKAKAFVEFLDGKLHKRSEKQ